MKKILLSIIFITIVTGGAIKASSAFFSDTETSANNILQAGILDLLVDNTSYYNGVLNDDTTWELDNLTDHLFFDFSDLKPDDWGEDTISLHLNDNEAWACMNMTMTANDDNGLTEPEQVDGDTTDGIGQGELAQNLNFVFWVDDGDNVFETGESILKQGNTSTVMDGENITLADSSVNKFGETLGRGLLPEETYFIGKAWCFGTLGLLPLTQDGSGEIRTPEGADTNGGITCDGTLLDNKTQTDIVNADVQFNVVQHRNNPDFTCEPPVIVSCETEDVQYASSFSDNDQGLRRNSSPVLASRNNPIFAYGAPTTTGTDYDSAVENTFFSLGFPLGGNNASIVFGFTEPFYNDGTSAPDLQIFEVTGGTNYPDERVKIEASPNGTDWTLLSASAVRDEAVDLDSLEYAQYIRLTDVSIGNFPNNATHAESDGYDLDAIQTFCKAETIN